MEGGCPLSGHGGLNCPRLGSSIGNRVSGGTGTVPHWLAFIFSDHPTKKKELAFQNYSTFKFQTYFSTGIHDGKKTFSPQVQAVRSHYWHIPYLQILLRAKPLQLCPALCDSMDCNLPGSSIHRIFQAGILEWVAMPFSRGSS